MSALFFCLELGTGGPCTLTLPILPIPLLRRCRQIAPMSRYIDRGRRRRTRRGNLGAISRAAFAAELGQSEEKSRCSCSAVSLHTLLKLLRGQGTPERKLHEIFVTLIVSRLFYALSARSGFLTGIQINRIKLNVFVKYDVLVCVPLHVFVKYQNILASLIVNYSRVCKARPTACLTYFHLRRTSVVCVLEDMVTSFSYVSRPL